MRLPKNRPPTHPGEILLEEFLNPLGMTQVELADQLQIPIQRVNEIVKGRRGITPDTAIRLAKAFGTSEELWLGLQQDCDLHEARQQFESAGVVITKIRVTSKLGGKEHTYTVHASTPKTHPMHSGHSKISKSSIVHGREGTILHSSAASAITGKHIVKGKGRHPAEKKR